MSNPFIEASSHPCVIVPKEPCIAERVDEFCEARINVIECITLNIMCEHEIVLTLKCFVM